jgi:hypothetical protein
MYIHFPTALAFAATGRPFSSSSSSATTLNSNNQRQVQQQGIRQQQQPLFLSDSSAGIASNGSNDEASATTVTTDNMMINGATIEQAGFPSFRDGDGDSNENNKLLSTLDRVRKISNFASFLCVLDCTILPIITVALPLLGVLNLGSNQLQAIDQLGHSLALYFVLPVGGLTTVINYISHKKKWISSLAILGLTMVGLANSHIDVHHWPSSLSLFGGTVSLNLNWIGGVLHSIQGCGTSPWHRIVNVSGCAFLLSSNYLSQQQDGCAHGDHDADGDCGHNHDHNHDHGGGGSCDH